MDWSGNWVNAVAVYLSIQINDFFDKVRWIKPKKCSPLNWNVTLVPVADISIFILFDSQAKPV